MAIENYAESYKTQVEVTSENLNKSVSIINALLSSKIPGYDFSIQDHNGKYPVESLNKAQLNALLNSSISDTARQRIHQQLKYIRRAMMS